MNPHQLKYKVLLEQARLRQGVPSKQCEQYYEALKNSDYFAAWLWYLPPVKVNRINENITQHSKDIETMYEEDLALREYRLEIAKQTLQQLGS